MRIQWEKFTVKAIVFWSQKEHPVSFYLRADIDTNGQQIPTSIGIPLQYFSLSLDGNIGMYEANLHFTRRRYRGKSSNSQKYRL